MIRHSRQLAAIAGLLLAVGTAARADTDTDEGRELYQTECSICHGASDGHKLIAPSLDGVFGRTAGSAGAYLYSDAVKQSGVTWDEETLDAYLTRPQLAIPGIRSTYQGMPLAEDRAVLLEYLKTLK